MITVFKENSLRYTEAGLAVHQAIHQPCEDRIDELLREGYNLRTVMVPASTPTAPASDYDVDPLEFQAIWMSEVLDICLDRLLFAESP